MIKVGHFLFIFFWYWAISSQMMVKLARNIRWVEIFWNFEIIDEVIFKTIVWRNNHQFDVLWQLKKWKVFVVSFLFDGLRGNFGLLTWNLCSKTQYQHKILRKVPVFSSEIMIFSQCSLMNWLPWQQGVTCLQSFNFKRYYR